MGGAFSFFDNDDIEDDTCEKMDDFSDISPPNEITIRKKKRITKEYDDEEVLEKSDMRKTRTKNRDKRKKTKRKRVSFQLDKNEY
jgi:hypothetical protein